MANFCNKCGNKLEPNSSFCSNCGNHISQESNNSNSFISQNVTKEFGNNEKSEANREQLDQKEQDITRLENGTEYQKKKRKITKISIVILILIIVLVYYLDKTRKEMIRSEMMKNMVECKAGSFMMGSHSRFKSPEEILHKVTISKPFYIGKYEVTQKDYETVMGNNPSNFRGDNRPVEMVSWNDAKEYCNKLNIKYKDYLPLGYRFDLPTEAQWEYACRAGTDTELNSGKNITNVGYRDICPNLNEVAWYGNNSGNFTHNVGQKKPNAWGIYDMHGNVLEWCRDYWSEKYSATEVTDPIGPLRADPIDGDYDSYRIYRGGCYKGLDFCCRSSFRAWTCYTQHIKSEDLGFRVAIVPAE